MQDESEKCDVLRKIWIADLEQTEAKLDCYAGRDEHNIKLQKKGSLDELVPFFISALRHAFIVQLSLTSVDSASVFGVLASLQGAGILQLYSIDFPNVAPGDFQELIFASPSTYRLALRKCRAPHNFFTDAFRRLCSEKKMIYVELQQALRRRVLRRRC